MSPSQFPQSTCPEHAQLLALATGSLADEDASRLDMHIAACGSCEATLDALEDDSDTLVRSLATLPVTTDDELAYRLGFNPLYKVVKNGEAVTPAN